MICGKNKNSCLFSNMKSIFLFLLFPIFSIGQASKTKKDDPRKLNSLRYVLESNFIAPKEIKLPFSSIRVIDNRYDTSKIGFNFTSRFLASKRKSFDKIDFKEGVEKSFEQFYNSYYENAFDNSGYKLVLVMKKFWLSLIARNKSKAINIVKFEAGGESIYYKIDYYLEKNNQYLPLKRIDSVFNINDKTFDLVNRTMEDKGRLIFVKNILKYFVEKYDFSMGINAFDNSPKKSYIEVQNYNKKMFNLKILQDSAFAKGVYLSFEDFKENKPSLLNFTEKRMRYSATRNEEYIEDVNGKAINQLWGYSDGNFFKIGIYSHDKIYRTNNTFEFFIPTVWYTQNTNSVGDIGLTITTNNRNEIWIPMQIDMETGEIY